jgi:peptide/nickel transport system permease protein
MATGGSTIRGLSPIVKRLTAERFSKFVIGILVAEVLIAILAPLISPYSPDQMNWGKEYASPNSTFLLGTDSLGRDVLSRVIWGTRTSLIIGVGAVIVIGMIGVTLGLASGFLGGIVDQVVMRTADTLLTLPSLLLLIAISAIFQIKSIFMIMLAIAVVGWSGLARITRSRVLSVKEELFVEAARGIGVGQWRIALRHVLPSCIAPVIVQLTMVVPGAILTEASLSFLGLGDPTAISWGLMISSGRSVLATAWWICTFPGLAIALTTFAFNYLGDALRDALDVRL